MKNKMSQQTAIIVAMIAVVVLAAGFYFDGQRESMRFIETINSGSNTGTNTGPGGNQTQQNNQIQREAITVSSISPASGPVGTVITIHGSGYTATKNTVNFGFGMGSTYPGYSSGDGTTITFTVPAEDNPMCPSDAPMCPLRAPDPIQPGQYDIFISNSDGASNKQIFTVTA